MRPVSGADRARVGIQKAVGRREFLARASRRGLFVTAAAGLAPALLAACGGDDTQPTAPAAGTPGATPDADAGASPVVGDVVDFALSSDQWEGAFGFVTLRLHHGVVDGSDVYFIRTDTSDEQFAKDEGLVWAPRLGGLASGPAGALYLFDDDQPAVLSSEPGRGDYTPAWVVNLARWTGEPGRVSSVSEVEGAAASGDLDVESTSIVVNAAVVASSNGGMPVDSELTEYLGPGQLIEEPDTDALEVTFKLHECFPGSYYIVVDTSLAPMADGMNVFHSPRLARSSRKEATGRTNVFMNGISGPGPMGFQPSVFDSAATDPDWSPYWDHFTYAWKDEGSARVLETEQEVHAARDDGELDEFPGTPETNGDTFTVNCPVPVVGPNTFTAPG